MRFSSGQLQCTDDVGRAELLPVGKGHVRLSDPASNAMCTNSTHCYACTYLAA